MENDQFLFQLQAYVETNIPYIFLENFQFNKNEIINFLSKNTGRKFNFIDTITQMTEDPQELSLETYETMFEDITSTLRSDIIIWVEGLENLINNSNQHPYFIDILYNYAQKIMTSRNVNITFIFFGQKYQIPDLLKDYSIIVKNNLPDIDQIEHIIKQFVKFHLSELFIESIDQKLIYLFKGLNHQQINQIISLLYYKYGVVLFNKPSESKVFKSIIEEIHNYKKQILSKMNTIEIIENKYNSADIAGYNNLKDYINNKKIIFRNPELISQNNLNHPKGIILLGKPGTGKSLAAKVIANELELPLIKFDISKILGKYVGQSEQHMVETLNIVQSMSPCVLWIDEIEKSFSGVNNDNNDTMRKILGIFLSWMSDENKGAFVVATANNIGSALPPEMTRKGRFDEIFYIDNPNQKARKEIFKLHCKKRNIIKYIDESTFNTISEKSNGLSGAEIEYCCNEVAVSYHVMSLSSSILKIEEDKFMYHINKILNEKNLFNSIDDLMNIYKLKYKEELNFADSIKNEKDSPLLSDLVLESIQQKISHEITQELGKMKLEKENKLKYKGV